MAQIAIKKSGNSVTVRIPSAILKALDLKVNDPVDIEMEAGRIVLTPALQQEEVQSPKVTEAGSLAAAARIAMGKTQQGMADYFGLTLSTWQKKEQGSIRTSVAEQHLFQLLSNQHPDYALLRKPSSNETAQGKATAAAIELAEYLSGLLVLPSGVIQRQQKVNDSVNELVQEWNDDINQGVGNALPSELTLLRAKLDDAVAEISELKKRLTKK